MSKQPLLTRRRIVLVLGFVAIVFALVSCFNFIMHDSCIDKGGIWVAESKSCICATENGFEVCIGEETEQTDDLIERISRD